MNRSDPRGAAVAEMKALTGEARWQENMQFIRSLRDELRRHPFVNHPAIELMATGQLDLPTLRKIHLEYRNAGVVIFTDALLMCQFRTTQLEPRFPPGAKIAARVLLTLNCLDEFGFRPDTTGTGYYQGHPRDAHYPLYEALLDDLGVTAEARANYQPSVYADKLRASMQGTYHSLIEIAAVLAVAEEEVIHYSPAMRRAVQAVGVPVESGYYYVHGVTSDDTAEAADDDHQNDLWNILAHALRPSDYDHIRALCLRYADEWDQFWTHQIEGWAAARSRTAAA